MVWAAAAAATVSALGAYDSNRRNSAEARRNRKFQERLSNTAVQRRVADMRAAGINPILAGKHEASTPGGSQAAAMQNIAGTAAQSAQAAASTRLTSEQAQKIEYENVGLGIKAREIKRLDDIAQKTAKGISEQNKDRGARTFGIADYGFKKGAEHKIPKNIAGKASKSVNVNYSATYHTDQWVTLWQKEHNGQMPSVKQIRDYHAALIKQGYSP